MVGPATKNPAVYPLRTRAALFGHNAIAWRDLPLPLRVGERHPDTNAFLPGPYKARESSWADKDVSSSETGVWLTSPTTPCRRGAGSSSPRPTTRSCTRSPRRSTRCTATSCSPARRRAVELRGERLSSFSPKDAVAWGGAERFPLIDPPRTAPIEGDRVPLETHVEGIEPGRLVAVSGVDADSGLPVADVRAVIEVVDDGAGSVLVLDRDLDHRFEPASLRVLANVAAATHGERGRRRSATATRGGRWLRFTLANAPLTYTSAAHADGRPEHADRARRRRRVGAGRHALRRGAGSAVYTVRHGDDASATVEFGDRQDAPPTGHENITAAYRVGLGGAGNRIAAGAIATPLTRPLGLRGVTNPVAATGGADPEALAGARRNAPLPILAMGRVVSLADFASFAARVRRHREGARRRCVERRAARRLPHRRHGAPAAPAPGDLTVGEPRRGDRCGATTPKVRVVVRVPGDRRSARAPRSRIDPRRAPPTCSRPPEAALTRRVLVRRARSGAAGAGQRGAAALHAVAGVIGVVLEGCYLVGELRPRRRGRAAGAAGTAARRWSPRSSLVLDPPAVDLTERGR